RGGLRLRLGTGPARSRHLGCPRHDGARADRAHAPQPGADRGRGRWRSRRRGEGLGIPRVDRRLPRVQRNVRTDLRVAAAAGANDDRRGGAPQHPGRDRRRPLPPADVSMRVDDLDTPSLLIDLDILTRNIDEMATVARDAGVKLRPHTKTHKSPEIARMQLEAGATGITVAKLGEAEVMAGSGLD